MKNNFRFNFLLAGGLFVTGFSTTTFSQDTLQHKHHLILNGQLRTRAEFRDGNFRPLEIGEKPAALVSQRVRFGLNYSFKDLLTIQFTPQFISLWGQEPMTQGSGISNGFGLYEAWAKIRVADGMNFQVGRQAISLDDERFFGALDWAQGGRAHDALRFNLNRKKVEFQAFGAFNQNYRTLYNNNLSNPTGMLYSPQGAIPYKWLGAVWLKYHFNEEHALSLLATNIGIQNATSATDSVKTFNNQTVGLNYTFRNDKWHLLADVYYQTGKSSPTKKVQAFLSGVEVHRQIKNWGIGIGSEYSGGDREISNTVAEHPKYDRNFNAFFSTGHKFFGSMDYFHSGSPMLEVSMWDNFLAVKVDIGKRWNLNLTAHQFLTTTAIYWNSTDRASGNLGQEFDLGFSVKINEFVALSGGYSVFLNTSTTDIVKMVEAKRDWQEWAWLSVNIHPRFLDFKQ